MFGQFAVFWVPEDEPELPVEEEPELPVAGAVVDGVVVVFPEDELPVAALAIAAPPPTRAPTRLRVTSALRKWCVCIDSPPFTLQ